MTDPARGRAALAALPLLAALALAGAAGAEPLRIERIAWLQGCWRAESPTRTIEEQWMPPRGRTMLGMGRTVRGDSLHDYELLMLREDAGALAYRAHPAGQPGATFLATEAGDSLVVFANPGHDFPQRVGYRRAGADSLIAWIEGERNGRTRRIEFPFRRVRCGEP